MREEEEFNVMMCELKDLDKESRGGLNEIERERMDS